MSATVIFKLQETISYCSSIYFEKAILRGRTLMKCARIEQIKTQNAKECTNNNNSTQNVWPRREHICSVLKTRLSKRETQHVNSMTRSCTPKERLLFQRRQVLGSPTLNDWLDSSQNSFFWHALQENRTILGAVKLSGYSITMVQIRC